jgi:small subunit ribosomal protein S1
MGFDGNDSEMSFDEMLNDSFAPGKKLSPGDKVKATVVRVGQDYVFLDFGMRTEGLMMRSEVTDESGEVTLAVGDETTVFVTAFRDGAILCGKRIGSSTGEDRSGDKEALMNTIREAFDSGMPVEGTVKETNKGGFDVQVMGVRGFCPISQIDNSFCETPEEHVGKTYGFEIIKFEEGGRNIVLSRRKILEREAEEAAKEVWETIKVGESYEGVVTSVMEFGAFVDIGGVQGLLHISEISYDRVEDPNEQLSKGQKLRVAVKDLDVEKQRISLSLKDLLDDPWDSTIASLSNNQIVNGRVVRLAPFGAFVELVPGIEGLVHISQMSGDRRINTPREVVAEGDQVDVRILEIDMERRRVSLSLNTEADESNWRDELSSSPSADSSTRTMGTLGDLFKIK